jgi:type IV pilus assembly protein PilA
MKRSKGFTLIELMIVVAIIGVLAAIAIPAYQNYTIRSQVTEGLSLAAGVKTDVEDYYANHGVFPDTIATAPSPANVTTQGSIKGKYVSSVGVTDGVVEITYGGQANSALQGGMVLSLTPYLDANNDVVWVCGTASVPANVTLGQYASGNGYGDAGTVSPGYNNIPSAYLPASCHS